MVSHTSSVQQAKARKMNPSGGMKVVRIMAFSPLHHFPSAWFAPRRFATSAP